MDFLREKFRSQCRLAQKQIYTHETCATDTNQVRLAIDDVITTIVTLNLSRSGIS